ncbi:MAG: topoisomerase DNA-binding C4 zinc finger domain-containing protein [Lachnospiraceae bacterium]|nr:topoisomerase DNA-binding C4 zinc finger domain-containing protein [Lachnospiraceae bacterium]
MLTAKPGLCPECSKPLVQREGPYGKFISCSGFPRCRYKPPRRNLK